MPAVKIDRRAKELKNDAVMRGVQMYCERLKRKYIEEQTFFRIQFTEEV